MDAIFTHHESPFFKSAIPVKERSFRYSVSLTLDGTPKRGAGD